MKYFYFLITIILLTSCFSYEENGLIAPQISISNLSNGETVADSVQIRVIVTDTEPIQAVYFYIDDVYLGIDYQEPFEIGWNTWKFKNGTHTVSCRVVDEEGVEALSEPITVIVHNVLFKANFTQDFLCPNCGEGILLLSDINGEIIWSGTWNGNTTIEVIPTENFKTLPERITVTTIVDNKESGEIQLTTNLLVNLKEMTWKNSPESPDEIDNATLYFTNIPTIQGLE